MSVRKWRNRSYPVGQKHKYSVQRYEISLLMLKNISLVSAANEWNIFHHVKRNFASPRDHVTVYWLFKHQWNNKSFHFEWNFLKICLTFQRCDLLWNHIDDLSKREDDITAFSRYSKTIKHASLFSFKIREENSWIFSLHLWKHFTLYENLRILGLTG